MSEEITTPSGLQYKITKEGEGEKVVDCFKYGKVKAKVHYEGALATNGAIFDSSVRRGEPFEFLVGTGQVIKGWDEALSDMRKGEKRIITLPPDLAYGESGHKLSGHTLVFGVELLDFSYE